MGQSRSPREFRRSLLPIAQNSPPASTRAYRPFATEPSRSLRLALFSPLERRGSQMEVPEEPLVEPASTRTLASILRIGQCLDATLSNLVSGVKVLKTEFWVRILVRSLGSVEREVAEANSYCRVLEESLNTRVVIQEIVED